ncbi:M48 family metallopeptidase [Chloracidobacterium thermophilum]|nr:M48 family metallopeptidase [Chloracidobacterium thermophilum]QUV77683.1 M48 family metalloprotease [Chloracidobacterium thermophilum]
MFSGRRFHRRMSWLLITGLLVGSVLPMGVRADDKDKKTNSPVTRKLSEKENPLMIGKRDINKGSLNFYSKEKEMAIGAQLAAELDRQLKFVTDPVVVEYINRLGQTIASNSDAKVPFTIKVVDSPEVNAFALPGGYFYVNKGLILAADNEAQVASVMAHEIAHVAARHATEQVSKGQLAQFGMIPLIFVGGVAGVLVANAANILVPLTFLKFGRNAEFEADMLGAQYAWASGYDPDEFIAFFEKLKAQQDPKQKIPTVFSTHPPTEERAAKMRQLTAAFPPRDEYIISSSEFARVKARLGAIAPDAGRRIGPGGGNDQPSRPTLRRRQPDAPPEEDDEMNTPADRPQKSEPSNRPTLRRRTDNNPPPDDGSPLSMASDGWRVVSSE